MSVFLLIKLFIPYLSLAKLVIMVFSDPLIDFLKILLQVLKNLVQKVFRKVVVEMYSSDKILGNLQNSQRNKCDGVF